MGIGPGKEERDEKKLGDARSTYTIFSQKRISYIWIKEGRMREIRTLYTWLEIKEDASLDEIKKAYRDKAKIHHPDRGGDPETFRKIRFEIK